MTDSGISPGPGFVFYNLKAVGATSELVMLRVGAGGVLTGKLTPEKTKPTKSFCSFL